MTETAPNTSTPDQGMSEGMSDSPADAAESIDAATDGDAHFRRALTEVVREHPVLVLAGGLAIGAAIAALLPKGTTRRVAGKAVRMAEVAGAAGVALGKGARERAEVTGEILREQGEAIGEHVGKAAQRARTLGEDAAQRIEQVVMPAGKKAAAAGQGIVDRVSDLASRIRH